MLAHLGVAQSTPSPQASAPQTKFYSPGPTAFVQWAGSHSPLGAVTSLTEDLGYNFTSHIGADIGLPLYTTRTPFSIYTDKDWRYTTILGTPYIDVRYTTKTRSGVNLTTILTGAFGLDSIRTYSTGRTILDWYNHFDHEFKPLGPTLTYTPFLNFGAGNGTFDRAVMASPYSTCRPYETFGYIANGEFGGTFTYRRIYKLSGSVHALLPMGPQKVFSRLVSPDSLIAGDGSHDRFFDRFFETISPLALDYLCTPTSAIYCNTTSVIARDNGFSTWLEVKRFRNFSIEVGYTRSVHYAYDSAFLMLTYDGTALLRNMTTGE
jgi:hypothetical protein